MRWAKRLGILTVGLAMAMVMSSKANADLVTIMDGTDTWTLNVATNCTTCAITLQVVYGAASARAGLYLDSVQWHIDNPNVNPSSDANIGFFATTAGTTANWAFTRANLNASQCGGGSTNSVCGAYVPGSPAPGGYGPIVAGSTLSWSFNTTFPSTLPASLVSGNIRAAYNNTDGSNAGIFSPGSWTFTTPGGGGSPSGKIPEPSTLILLGSGLVALAGFGGRKFKK